MRKSSDSHRKVIGDDVDVEVRSCCTISEDLEITSLDNNKQIMSIRHKKFDVKGVQFHPESILTPYGKKIIENWIKS